MRILYITQYFHPEIGATTNRALANVRCFANIGHDVTVLTEMPNHPKGIIFDGYKHKMFMKEKMEDFMIHRVWVFTSVKKNFITRILFYISFMFMGFLHTLFNWKKYDVIYVTSPPLFAGVIGYFLKKIYRRTKFIFEVRDLWPDVAIEMRELQNKQYQNLSYKMERDFYKSADKIISVTESFKERIVAKGIYGDKINVVRNGTDLEFNKVTVSEQLRNHFEVENNFIVVYAGILGIAQNIKTLLESGKQLSSYNVKILLVGSGPEERILKEYAKDNKISNVIFIGEVTKADVGEYLMLADCGIIPLRNIKVFESTIPSKLFDYMAASLPILLGVKGEAAEILKQAKAGITYEPDDSEDLAIKILWLKNNPNQLKQMSLNGRKFVEINYNRMKKAEELEKILIDVVMNNHEI